MESVAFIPSGYEDTYSGVARFDEKGDYLSEEAYAREYMRLSNTEDVCRLASLSMEAYNRLADTISNENAMTADPEGTDSRWSTATLIYRSRSGGKSAQPS